MEEVDFVGGLTVKSADVKGWAEPRLPCQDWAMMNLALPQGILCNRQVTLSLSVNVLVTHDLKHPFSRDMLYLSHHYQRRVEGYRRSQK
jgi:hypothetical protein